MLFATGCSHTYGDDLQDKRKAWPFLLGEKINLSVHNNAVSGGTNQRSVYETIKAVTDREYELIVVGWTYVERHTFYRVDNNFQINFNPVLKHSLYDSDPSYTQFGKLLYAHWHNDLFAFKLWLQQILQLQSYLISRKQRYLMLNLAHNNITKWNSNFNSLINFDLMNDEQIEQERIEIQNYLDQIDHNSYYEFYNYHIEKYDFPLGATGHYLEEGHRDIADRLYNFICSR